MSPIIIDEDPEADIPFPGINSKLIQAGQQQLIFMAFEQDIEIAELLDLRIQRLNWAGHKPNISTRSSFK
ncbi:hypothetical protein L0P88_15585 [Muricauda sp. SCSIO 64092]|uniref:hypothetical protein n=1 Tax=Allomuricauda sp. SCSIO 64092 TaxID=2908842 RepID=UPI001FF1516F|nr:hypothetical protein [Muricauda sp. SCSIO 64092]UOY05367.1 hypothetical protein L0P88_15585 [Muricauda sp. SCSIO 64092]